MSCSELPTTPRLAAALVAVESVARRSATYRSPGSTSFSFARMASLPLSNANSRQHFYGGTVDRVYSSAINGAAMKLSDDAAAALRADPRVLSVEQDEVIREDATTQLNATWGLDRIDQRTRPLSGSYVYGANGSGVTVYIIDSGINFGQADFGGRAETGYDAITPGGTAADCEGHGSHVAGTVGSNTYGVAKNVRLVAVRVLDCHGNGSFVVGARGHRLGDDTSHAAGRREHEHRRRSQCDGESGGAELDCGGHHLRRVRRQRLDRRMHAVASECTRRADDRRHGQRRCICRATPISAVAWTCSRRARTSRRGGRDRERPRMSGTSMSTPHVAGAAALYLQLNPTATPAQVRAALVGNATAGIVTGVPSGTPNLLLYIGFIQAPSAPVADFTSNCVGNVVQLRCELLRHHRGRRRRTSGHSATRRVAAERRRRTRTRRQGPYAVTLTITDPNGTSSKTANVVLNRAPTAVIATPAANASFVQGTPVTFTGNGHRSGGRCADAARRSSGRAARWRDRNGRRSPHDALRRQPHHHAHRERRAERDGDGHRRHHVTATVRRATVTSRRTTGNAQRTA